MQLEGRVALVTGGSRGIGRAACLAFAREGAHVAVHYHEQEQQAGRVAGQVRGAGVEAAIVRADVTDPDEVERMMAEVADFAGERGLSILFNNAGVYPAGSLETLSVEDWDRVIAVHVRGPFLCTRAALPLLKAAAGAGSARVINIGSVIPYLGVPGFIHYSTAKAALIGFTHSLARELADYGITVNCIVPSMVATETAVRDHSGAEEGVLEQQAIKRLQRPEDLAGTLVFLASAASDFMTGQTIMVDGGRVLR
jgi:3-oxoacyl-[acyl-carrier protein] reductase